MDKCSAFIHIPTKPTATNLISEKTNAVYDYGFVKALSAIDMKEWMEKSPPFDCRLDYLSLIDQRIKETKINKIEGLDKFPEHHLINGTTQEFDEAYYRHSGRRLRFFKGEYAYHRRNNEYTFIEDDIIDSNDYIIISAPFCSTGDVHPQFYTILDTAFTKKVPVIIDCAYFGTCSRFMVNLNHPAIESVSFSLSKGLGLGDIRSGIRYSKINEGPIKQQNDYNHTVLLAAKIGIHMLERFDFDYIPNRYQKHQINICKQVGITPTKCMHLALGDDSWKDYRIDDTYNRLGIRNLVKYAYKKDI